VGVLTAIIYSLLQKKGDAMLVLIERKCVWFFVAVFQVFLGILLGLQALHAAEYPWKLQLQKDGISVYTRKVEDSPILEYKADVIVDAPLAKVIALFEEVTNRTEWYYRCVRSELLEDAGSGQTILYFVMDLPGPVARRDCVYRAIKSVDSQTGSVRYALDALPERLAKQKGMIRVPYLKSEWRFTPIADGRTEIYFQQHSSAGGSIPAFLANSLAVDIPFYSLKNFRVLLTAGKT
jgi:hypothetical protein